MSFKDLTTRAAALLNSKPAETPKKEPAVKAEKAGSNKSHAEPKKP